MKVTHLDAAASGRALKRLMDDYRHFHWAVAWATETNLSAALLVHKKKIRQFVMGIDFDHTSPALLRKLMPLKSVHVATSEPRATFHPKVYGFVDGERVAVLIGSSNFTRGGTSSNEEACLLLEGDAQDQPLQALLASVSAWWTDGDEIKPDFLEAYERRCAANKEHRKALERKLFVPHPKAGAKHPDLLSLSWRDYVDLVKTDGDDHLDRRLEVLRTASIIFAEASSFADIDSIERKAIAGYVGHRERDSNPRLANLDWGWFGSMQGAGVFKSQVADGKHGRADPHLSDAMECIPTTGAVSEDDYLAFVNLFRRAFATTKRQGRLATATRLLAMKRPDYFVCVDSENRTQLARDIGFAASSLSMDSYWDLVVEPVMTARWWNGRRPGGREGRVWDGRSAMLDAIYYVPKNTGS